MRNIERLFNVAQRGLFRNNSTLGYDRTLAAIERLANAVDDYDGDTDWCIGESSECSLDSLLIGAYWYCTDYHGGQWSDEYRLLSAIGDFFDPRCSSLERDSSQFDVCVALAALAGHGTWDEIVEGYDNDDC